MSYYVKSFNKKTGITYVYSAESYYIPGVGSRSHRRCIGKINPDTGEIVPTGKRGPKPKQKAVAESIAAEGAEPVESAKIKSALIDSTQKVNALEATVKEQREKIASLEVQIERMQKAFFTIQGALQKGFGDTM